MLALIHLTSGHQNHTHIAHSPHHYSHTNDTIPFSTRAFWMRRANAALGELDSPCPFAAFGTVIVNHTDLSEGPHGKAVCYGVNTNRKTGNPTLHGMYLVPLASGERLPTNFSTRQNLISETDNRIGEMAGIDNCSSILTDPEGEHKLSPADALLAFSSLSLYTNAEPCPMVNFPPLPLSYHVSEANEWTSAPLPSDGQVSRNVSSGRA